MLLRVLSGLLGRFFEEDFVVEEGKITATNATLRPEGLKLFGIPAALRKGKIGFLALRITNEGKRVHAHIEVRDLLLVLGQKEEGSDESRAARSRAQVPTPTSLRSALPSPVLIERIICDRRLWQI
eukprot:1353066-Rhodomonas_salina.1